METIGVSGMIQTNNRTHLLGVEEQNTIGTCKWCGGTGEWVGFPGKIAIQCAECKIGTFLFNTKEEALYYWEQHHKAVNRSEREREGR